MVAFPPVVEPDLPGAFIAKHPLDEDESHGSQFPFLTGLTSGEGAAKAAREMTVILLLQTIFKLIFVFNLTAILNIPNLLEDFSKNYEKALPIALYYNHHPREVQSAITNKIIEYYFNGESPAAAKQQNITNVRGKES